MTDPPSRFFLPVNAHRGLLLTSTGSTTIFLATATASTIAAFLLLGGTHIPLAVGPASTVSASKGFFKGNGRPWVMYTGAAGRHSLKDLLDRG